MITTVTRGQNVTVQNDKIYHLTQNNGDNIKDNILELALTTGMLFKKSKRKNGTIACFINTPGKIIFKKGKTLSSANANKGDIFVIGYKIRKELESSFPDDTQILYETNHLPEIYNTTEGRKKYAGKITGTFSELKNKPDWDQCLLNCNLKLDFIGKGSFGNVFKYSNFSRPCALKITKIKPEAVKDSFCDSWNELYFLKNAIKPLILDNICPNLPLVYEDFKCKSCELTTFQGDKIKTPTFGIAIELANGTLKQYIQSKRTVAELDCALFQSMAALHCIQYHHQLMNYDIKKENILYYDVEPGGFWMYTICGINYYVPNFGKLFILNDFGLARSTSPAHILPITDKKYSRLGRRYAVIKDDKFIPFSSKSGGEGKKISWDSLNEKTTGIEFKLGENGTVYDCEVQMNEYLCDYLSSKGINTNELSANFFSHPEIIPPFEFYNDTQDLIRSFVGGKRATQKGDHRKCKEIPKEFEEKLLPYVGKCKMLVDQKVQFDLEPCFVLASRFIKKYFSHYTIKPRGKIIASYKIS
jgi:hypothetical protein